MDFLLIKYLHILCFVYWLGGDLGTFIASRSLINESYSSSARVVAAKILIACDQGPRFAMPLILATGIHMAWLLHLLPGPGLMIVGSWLICGFWLALVIALHFIHGKTPAWITYSDWTLRIAVCLTAFTCGISTLITQKPLLVDWAGLKLLLFSLTVLMGLLVRVKLKPFFGAFAQLAQGNDDADTNRIIRGCIQGTVPYVMTIWVLLFILAAIGVHLIP